MTGKKIASFQERFAELVNASGKSQSAIADDLGMSKQALSTWVNGTASPKKPTLLTLASYFNVSIDWIMGFDVPQKADTLDVFQYKNIVPIRKFTVPLLGSVAAGQPIYADEDYETRLPVGQSIKCDFALRVKGTSMEPGIKDGDIVFVRKQSDVDDGRIAVVGIGEEATLKHVYKSRDGVTLVSDNPEFRPMVYTGEECEEIRIIGKPVAYLRGM